MYFFTQNTQPDKFNNYFNYSSDVSSVLGNLMTVTFSSLLYDYSYSTFY